jgi:hypothetical protein
MTQATITRRYLLAMASSLIGLPLGAFSPQPSVAKGFHLVNGWILTTKDLEALNLHDF